VNEVLLTAGVAAIIIAVVGGGAKALGIEVRALESGGRQLALGLVGVLFLGLAVALRDDGSGGEDGNRQGEPQRPQQVRLSLPSPSVHRLTFRDWMIANALDPKEAPREQLDDVGVTVEYELQAPGYSTGSEFPVSFRVLRRTPVGGEAFVDAFQDPAQLEVDSDSCTCTSSFIPIRRTRNRYRIEIQVFRPGGKTHSPLKKAYTEWFPGFS
jgi:hypothetical protein